MNIRVRFKSIRESGFVYPLVSNFLVGFSITLEVNILA